ncbi:hypothetical protein BST61_g8101 [Cercospora zeina]
MFKTLLLATVAGAGTANVPASASDLVARNDYPKSYLCSTVNKKCSGTKAKASVIAYCSSLLKLPQITRTTKTIAYCTTTKTETKIVATITKPAKTVTSTVNCAAPATTLVIDDEPTDGNNETPEPEGNVKREARAPEPYGPNTVHVPSCLSSCIKSAQLITSACKCASITPRTTTVTSTEKVTREVTSTVSVTSTATKKDACTTFVVPTFAIVNENGRYLNADVDNSTRSGVGFDDGFRGLLFELNGKGVLVSNTGRYAAEPLRDTPDPRSIDNDPEIYLIPQNNSDFPNYKPLTCSISYEATGPTCPLMCQYSSSSDRNLVAPPDSYRFGRPPWWVGEPNEEKNLTATYKTYAVTRGEGGNRGGFGGRGGSSIRSERKMRSGSGDH